MPSGKKRVLNLPFSCHNVTCNMHAHMLRRMGNYLSASGTVNMS